MTEQMSNEGLDLMAQLVGANVASLAATTDRLIEGLERDIRGLAATVVAFHEVLEDALVIDRQTEHRLRMLDGKVDAAYRMLERMDER